jgi:diguanylate cyclase (GGDEF)-like protein
VIGTSLFLVTVALLVVREAMNSRIRSRLVTWLSTEALRDALTDLPNRRALTTMIRNVDLTTPWVLLTVDLDGFKEVNDLLGPEAGDELIVAVAGALQRTCPASGVVARIGGDEFGVLSPGTVQDGEHLAERLATAVRTTVHDRELGVALSASVGVGRVLPEPDAAASADRPSSGAADVEPRGRLTALVESAAALRAAKAVGRDQVAVYPGAVEQARQRRLLIERRLRSALDAGTLDMHAQPLIHLRSGRIAGFESLARWTDELLGSVSPAEFVPVAEQSGLITALGEFALRNTLLQARAGGVTGLDVELGVNVSPIQLRLPSFAPMVVDLVAELGLAPRQLLLEVTEAILVDEDDPASGSLAALAAAGIQLAIDDFGTGYSALGYLRRLPVDMLKIDRSWVVASVHDQRTRDIVGGVVSLAHTLGATVVMEGIEDTATARMCVDVGADLGQGFLFGRPQPWPLAAEELQAAPWRPAATGDVSAADVNADPVGARGPRSRPGDPRGATS